MGQLSKTISYIFTDRFGVDSCFLGNLLNGEPTRRAAARCSVDL
jgi:hypothetical protein